MPGMEQLAGFSLQQTLAPQMQQSLQILQAPVAELRLLARQELEANPVLEEDPDEAADPLDGESETLSRLDEEWNQYLTQSRILANPERDEWLRERLDSFNRPLSLQDNLLEQARFADFSERQHRIAENIIGNLDDDGFLQVTDEEIAWLSSAEASEVPPVRQVIQGFDPIGVGSRNLSECLQAQLRRLGKGGGLEEELVVNHLQDLGRRRFVDLARKLGDVTAQDIQAAVDIIATLNPRPGRLISGEAETAVFPDVVIEKTDGEWEASLRNERIPSLRISSSYKDLLTGAGSNREVREYIRDKIRGGKFFIRSIEQRQQTILSIAREIVARQKDFLENGPGSLRPMTMSQIAEAIGFHETTVSRAISGKFVDTPHGVFEMRYFFSTGYETAEGESVSNRSVKEAIADLIRDENARKPMSDQEIVGILAERGIPIARRTVAKYRDQLGILPSSMRRKY